MAGHLRTICAKWNERPKCEVAQMGIAFGDAVGIDTLGSRLREAVIEARSQIVAPDWGSVSAGRRIGVSASAEVRPLFDTAIMTRRSRRS